MRFAAVVLAAGRSQRMGANKLLLEVAGRPMLDLLLDALDASPLDEVLVVLGHRPDELRGIVESHNAQAVINPNYDTGMTSSFKSGLRRVAADAAFLILGDQLGLMPQLIEEMESLMSSDPGALVVSPAYQGRRGHPVLFRRELFPEVLSLDDSATLRDLILHHEDSHRLIEGDQWCVVDIDTPEDFEKAKQLWRSSKR